MMKTTVLAALLAVLPLSAPAFAAEYEVGQYVPATDPPGVRKLELWQAWKFGFMMHWGP